MYPDRLRTDPAEVFGKGTDTDVEWNIMKQKFGKYSDAKALFPPF